MLVKPSNKEYSMDGYLKSNIDIAKNVIEKDWDMVFIIDGTEGGGKSVIAQQLANYCSPKFNIEQIGFKPETFREIIIKSNKYDSVIYDEAYGGLSSRGAMSEVNKVLVSMLAEIRQKNLFVFIIIPSFFDLDRYVALWRSRALIHVYTGEGFERGYFAFYNSEKKKDLYVNGKKYYSYSNPKANFIGRFPNTYTVDEEEYRRRKLAALSDYGHRKKKDDERFPIALKALCNHVSTRQAASELSLLGLELSYRRIAQLIEKRKENELSEM